MIPLRDEIPSSRVPLVGRAIILANVLVFFYQLSLGEALRRFMFEWGMVPLRITLAIQEGGEPLIAAALPLVTSMFLHGGIVHMAGNMWYLWVFGDNVEDRFGPAGFLLFYLAAGLVAGLVHFAFNTGSRVPTVGASGAIAGVLGAYIVAFPRARILMLLPLVIIWQVVAMPAIIALGLWFVLQFFNGALSLVAERTGGGTAWWAHIGGFAFGAVIMAALGGRKPPASRAWVS